MDKMEFATTSTSSSEQQQQQQPSLLLLSLSDDLWSECFQWLSPQDIANAVSTLICKDNSVVSDAEDEVSERAAWLALQSIITTTTTTKTTTNVGLYPDEKWLEVYELFWFLVTTATEQLRECQGECQNDDNDNDNDSDSDNIMNGGRVAACWLLFGSPNERSLPPFPVSSSSSTSIGHANYASLVGSLLQRKTSSLFLPQGGGNGNELRRKQQRYRTRMMQSALRLGDAGDWSTASDLLCFLISADHNNHGGEGGTATATATATAGSQETGREAGEAEGLQPQHHRHEQYRDHPLSEEERAKEAEINASICTFLVDRLYSRTYVDPSGLESLCQATVCGRQAVALCLESSSQRQEQQQQQRQQQQPQAAKTNHNNINQQQQQQRPPPAALLYPSNSLRLAACCLALGKALALLAQTIGLCGVPADGIHHNVQPMEQDENDGRRNIEELFFREGEAVLKTSISRLEEEEKEEDSDSCSCANRSLLFEIKAATWAALGELYYCSASVASYHYNREIRSRQTQESIKHLTMSLSMVQQHLVDLVDIGRGCPPVTVESLCCSNIIPRSLLMLQARTAKDLGKVYNFDYPPQVLEGQKVLDFGLALNSRLHFKDHPSIANIERLRSHSRIDRRSVVVSEEILENNVNQWMNRNVLFKKE